MKIQQKLFLLQSGFSLMLVATLVLLMQWSIGKGMVDYVNTKEIETFAPVVSQLAKVYDKSKSWSSFLNVTEDRKNERLRELIMQYHKSTNLAGPGFRPREYHENFQPSEHMPPPPKHDDENRLHIHPQDKHPRHYSEHGSLKQSHKGNRPPPEHEIHFVLFDGKNNHIAGNYVKNLSYSRTPILVDDIVIGYFGILKRERLTQGYELDFLNQQQSFLWLIALLVMVFVVLLTLPLARHIVKPIQLITSGMHKLAQGDYQQKIIVNRKDELGQLSCDYNELAFTLDENESARKRWLANISHELRTPIAIASLELEAMLDGIRTMTKENIASAHDELSHLTNLIDDLHQLTLADIGGMQYNKKNEDLSLLLKSVKNKYQRYLAESNITLTMNLLDKPINVYADKIRLLQLFENIINNSIKYAQASQLQISLRFNTDTNQGSVTGAMSPFVYLSFEDDGVGVDDEHLPHLFEYLYRTDESRNRKSGGAGLGLSICRQIVVSHQGEVWAEKSSLSGLAITIKLPVA